MAGDLGKATFALEADTGQFKRGLDQAKGMAQSSTASIGQNFQRMGGGMQQAGRGLTMGLTAPIVGLGFVATKTFGDFDAAMTQSLAIMGDVQPAMRTEMEETARSVALTTTFSAQQAAEAYFFLASAGLNAQQSIGAMPAVALFAQAGMFDMALATDLATDAQSALGLRSKDAAQDVENLTRVTDVLVKANTMANATVEQFARSLTAKGGSALKAANKDIEEGIGLLAFWADQGLKGEAAGTALAGVLTMLPKLAVKNTEAFADYGVEIFTSTGELKTFSEIAAEFAPILENMSVAERALAYEQMGINRLMVDAINKMKGGEQAIADYTAGAYEAGGITKEVAEKQLKTFNAQMSLLKSQVQDVFIILGSALVPVLQDVVKGLKPVIKGIGKGAELFGKLPKPIKIAVFAFLLLLAAIGPLLMMAGMFVAAIGSLLIFLPMIAPMILPIVGGFIGLLPVIGLVIVALAMLGFAIAAIIVNFSDIKRAVTGVLQGVIDFVKKQWPQIATLLAGPFAPLVALATDGFGIRSALVGAFRSIIRGAAKLGGDFITGIARGVAAAASALYRVVAAVVSNVVKLLNPFSWIFGSSMEDVYSEAGGGAGGALVESLQRAIEAGMGGVTGAIRRPLEAMRNVIGDVRSELDRLSSMPSVESAVEDLQRAELSLSQLEFKEQLRVGDERISQVDEEIERIRDQQDEFQDLVRASQERVDEIDVEIDKVHERRAAFDEDTKKGEERIKQADDEIKRLVDQRNKVVFLAKGRTKESDAIDAAIKAKILEKKNLEEVAEGRVKEGEAIDDQLSELEKEKKKREAVVKARQKESEAFDKKIRDLEKEKKAIEDSLKPARDKYDAIQDEIDAVDRLGERRNLEREIAVARAKVADASLATDAEVISQLGAMEGVMGDVTGEIDKQADALWTQFIPAWEDIVEGLKEADAAAEDAGGGAGAGAEELAEGLGDLEDLLEDFDGEGLIGEILPDPGKIIGEQVDKFKKTINKYLPVLALAVVGLILAPFVGVPVLLGVAIGALLGFLWVEFHDEIIGFFEESGKKVLGFIKKLWGSTLGKVLLLAITGAFAPIVALVTDAFGIRTALFNVGKEIIGFVKEHWKEIVTLISGPFMPLVALATDAFGIRSALIGAFNALWTKTKQIFEDIVEGITGAFKSMLSWITTNWAGVIAEIILAPFFFIRVGVSDLWGIRSGLISAFTAVLNFIVSTMGLIKNSFVTGFNEIVSFVSTAMTNIATFVVNTLIALPGAVVNLAATIGTTIFNAVLSGLGMLADIHTRITDALGVALGAVSNIAMSIGRSILAGLRAGLGNIGQELWDKIPGPLKWVFEKLASGVKIVVDIDWPSPKDIPIIGGIFGQHGIWSVPGQGRQDTVPAKLTPGEMVLPRDSAQVLRDFFGGDTGGGGRGDINVTVHNPHPEAAEDTVQRRLQALSQLGVTE